MAPTKNLSTPTWPAEQRAWLLIYGQRFSHKIVLVEESHKLFPERANKEIFGHLKNHVQTADLETQAKLEELGKTFAWYQAPPKEGELGHRTGHGLMKKIENDNEARGRSNFKKKYKPTVPATQDAGAASDEQEVSPPSSPSQAEGQPKHRAHSGAPDSPISIASSEPED